jgi:hypothetical protein
MTRYNFEDGQFRLTYNSFTIQPNDIWSWTFGYFFMQDDFRPAPYGWGEGNNLFRNSLTFRVNQNWALRATQHYNADDGRMEEQAYSIYRDLKSWTAALSFRVRDNVDREDDFTIAFTVSLKAYPSYDVGEDSLRSYSLLGD